MAHIITITNPITGLPEQVIESDYTAQQIDDSVGRAAQGGAIDAALSNKANVAAATILTWDDLMSAKSGWYLVSSSAEGMPVPGAWWHIDLLSDASGQNKTISAHKVSGQTELWTGSIVNGGAAEWDGPYATATPPQEYDLPLAEGVSKELVATYSKAQDGMVTVSANVRVLVAGEYTTIAALPIGFRPLDFCACAAGTFAGGGVIEMLNSGEIRFVQSGTPSGSTVTVSFNASFVGRR